MLSKGLAFPLASHAYCLAKSLCCLVLKVSRFIPQCTMRFELNSMEGGKLFLSREAVSMIKYLGSVQSLKSERELVCVCRGGGEHGRRRGAVMTDGDCWRPSWVGSGVRIAGS